MALHDCRARFRVMSCGRRFGKTLAATNELAKKALERPSSLNWWIAPTYRQTEIAFELLASAMQPALVKPANRSRMRLDLLNGSVIECRSAERYENMRGDGPSFVVFDEASKCPKAAWTEVVRPALADNQGGAIFISTPWGRDWFWELFQRGQDDKEKDYWSKSFPTSSNPFIPAGEIEEARRTLPQRVFEQEFLAVFLDDAATVFRHVDDCAVGKLKGPEQGHTYVIGWDVAKYSDYSVLTCLNCDTGEVVAWERFNGMEYHRQMDEYVVPMVKRYLDAHVLMDVTGVGDPILEELRKREISVEGFYFTNTSKKELIDRTVVAIEQQQIAYPPIETLLEELKDFTYEITKARNIVYGAPDGKHDDAVISLALAVYGAKLGGRIAAALTTRAYPDLPQAKIVDAATDDEHERWIQQRRDAMARSLHALETGVLGQSHIIDSDSGWGVA